LTDAASGQWWGAADELIPDLALDLLDARAEVERLRGIATDAVGWLDSRYHAGRVDAQARFRAKLSLPTPAPEATE
jgi:hypothetical protein